MSFVKALLAARDTLLEEMKTLSKAVSQTIDLSEFVSNMDNGLLSDSAPMGKSDEVEEGSGQGKQQNNLEVLPLFCCRVYFFICYPVSLCFEI